jgi:hypothetical protein
MTTIDEKEILEIEKLKADYRKVIQDLDVTLKPYYLKLYGAFIGTIALTIAINKVFL